MSDVENSNEKREDQEVLSSDDKIEKPASEPGLNTDKSHENIDEKLAPKLNNDAAINTELPQATAVINEAAKKAEEILQERLKETQKNIQRYQLHSMPTWESEQEDNRMWDVRVYPVDHEDIRNCIMESAAKAAHQIMFYVPKKKHGLGVAQFNMTSTQQAAQVMGRLVRVPFYYRFVTIVLTRHGQPTQQGTIVFDTTKSGRIKNNQVSQEGQKSLWLRYVPDTTSCEFLKVLFPLAESVQDQVHDALRIGLVEANSKSDAQIMMRAYVTIIINDSHILSFSTKEPMEKESEIKIELEKAVQTFGELKLAPLDIPDRLNQRRDDKSETARIMKRTMYPYHGGEQPPYKRSRMEQPHKGMGWLETPLVANRFTGAGGFRGQLNPRGITEMVMMQARLNQTLQNQLMLLNPGARRGGFNAGFGNRYGGAGHIRGGRGSRMGGSKGFGGGW